MTRHDVDGENVCLDAAPVLQLSAEMTKAVPTSVPGRSVRTNISLDLGNIVQYVDSLVLRQRGRFYDTETDGLA